MRKKGFTLIELLIVVAIIAILAAIAVPNFLEAQVRSKVSRVKADQRSLATAIESYYVDNNLYPAVDSSKRNSDSSGFGVNNHPNSTPSLLDLPTFRTKKDANDGLVTLTTPISYITSYFPDPFARTRGGTFEFSTPDNVTGAITAEVAISGWIVWSFGPDNDEVDANDGLGGDIKVLNLGGENPRVVESMYNPSSQVPIAELLLVTYDPTNGTTSNGDVYRFKQ